MDRTTVRLPRELRRRANRCAKERGVSFSDFLRAALEQAIREDAYRNDPFFKLMENPVKGADLPRDLAERHDHYLYDEER